MTELDNLSKSETPNLATLHRLACTGSYSSINCGDRQLFPNFKILYRPNGEKYLNSVFHFYLDCPALSFETTPTSVLRFSDCN